MKKTALILVLLGALMLVFGAIKPTGDVVAQGKPKTADGKGAYQAQCAKCHGVDGKGIPSLPDIPNFADAKWHSSRTDKKIADVINIGAGIMPGFKEVLTPTDVRAVVKYIRAFAPAKGKSK